MKNLFLLLSLVLTTTLAWPAASPEKIQKDSLQLGLATSGLSKQFIFDTNDGASNKKISIDSATKKISINTDVETTGTLTGDGVVNAQGELKLGSGTNASKQMTVDRAGFDPYVKWNEASQKWVFSQDGTNEKNFGSGSGGEGGVNLLQNPSFEDGISVDWTSSGGTFSLQPYATPDPSGNDAFYARFIASGAGQYFESVAKAIPSNLVGGCLAKINYNTTDAANWKLQVYDGSANLLKEETLLVKNWKDGYASFTCPTVGTTVKMRVISIAAGQIEGDKAHLGSETRTFQIAQAKFIGRGKWPKTTNCAWTGTTTGATVVNSFAADSDCPSSPTLEGTLSAAATKIPAVVIPNGGAGTYKVTVTGLFLSTHVTSATACVYKISDGTTDSGTLWVGDTTSNTLTGSTIVGFFNYPASFTNKQLEVKYTRNQGGGNCVLDVTADIDLPEISVEYIPSDAQTALRPEAQAWMIDVNIGGTNPSMGTGNVTSYTGIEGLTLDMVLNSGSVAAKIPCSSTNGSTGLTCSAGSESVGVNFVNKEVGFYEACFDYSYESAANTAGAIMATFQVVETANNAQTIIQEGKTRISTKLSPGSTSASIVPFRNCGVFYFSSVGERTLRLMYEQNVSGTVLTSQLTTDRNALIGQQDIHVVVRPLLSAYGRPYLTSDSPVTVIARDTGTSVPNNVETVIPYASEEDDNWNAFDPTTGTFTAPKDGFYLFGVDVIFQSGSWPAATKLYANVNVGATPTTLCYTVVATTGSEQYGCNGSKLIKLTKGQTVTIKVNQTSGNPRSTNAATSVNKLFIVRQGQN